MKELKFITLVAAVGFLIPQLVSLWVLRLRPLVVVARPLAVSIGAYALFLVSLFLLCYRPLSKLTMATSSLETIHYGLLIRILTPFPIGIVSCGLALYAGATASSDSKTIMLQKVAKSVCIAGVLVYLIQVATVIFVFNH